MLGARLARLGRLGSPWGAALLVLASAPLLGPGDGHSFLLVALLALIELVPARPPPPLLRLVLGIALGLLAVIKVTFVSAGAIVLAPLALAALQQRRLPLSALTALATVAASWLLLGLGWGEWVAYLDWSLREITPGYSQAMQHRATTLLVWHAVAVSGALLVWIAVLARRRLPHGWWAPPLAAAGVLFLQFKAGFVRADVHVFITAFALLLEGLALAVLLGRRGRCSAPCSSWRCRGRCWGMRWSPNPRRPSPTASCRQAVSPPAWRRCRRSSAATPSPRRTRSTFAICAARWPCRRSTAVSTCSAIGRVCWSPTSRRTGHGRCSRATWPTRRASRTRTPTSWPALRHRAGCCSIRRPSTTASRPSTTRPRGHCCSACISQRAQSDALRCSSSAPAPRAWRLVPLGGADALTDQPITVPPTDGGPIWARIDVQETALDHLQTLLFAAPYQYVDVVYVTNAVWRARLVAAIARDGFLLSPVVDTVPGFVALATQGPQAIATQAVREIRVHVDSPFGEPGAARRARRLRALGDRARAVIHP